MKFFFQDWEVNRGNLRSQMILLCFRIVQYFSGLPYGLRWIGTPLFFFYEVIIVSLLGIEISYKATIGPHLQLFHGGRGTVIHESVVIGSHCKLRHGTTIGMRREAHDVPRLGNNIDIGCHSLLLGAIRVADGATIGAGSVVLHDVPAFTVVAGNPAKIIKATL